MPFKLRISLFFSLFAIHFFGELSAQSNITGSIVDVQTKVANPYVNIGIVEQERGTVSNFDGKFTLNLHKGDEVTFSAIGYKSQILVESDLFNDIIVKLAPTKYALEIIDVQASTLESEEKIFGLRNETRGHSIGFGNIQLGAEIGAPILIEKSTYVKSANFVLNHAKGDSLLFRVNIYKLADGNVGENLLEENKFI